MGPVEKLLGETIASAPIERHRQCTCQASLLPATRRPRHCGVNATCSRREPRQHRVHGALVGLRHSLVVGDLAEAESAACRAASLWHPLSGRR